MQFAENVRKGPVGLLMNACRRTGSFGNAQSTVVKDFGAFQGLPPPVLDMRRVVARTRPIFRQIPLA